MKFRLVMKYTERNNPHTYWSVQPDFVRPYFSVFMFEK
jgi:hypothetical protein